MRPEISSILPDECVQDYPRPPRLEPVPHRLRVELEGELVAETTRGLRALETHHAPSYYFPVNDVRATLTAIPGRTFCEWKGVARFFQVAVAGMSVDRAAWSYAKPASRFAAITGYVAFYAGRMTACFVGEVPVLPQPGPYYGGWVTPNLRGKIKGGHGPDPV